MKKAKGDYEIQTVANALRLLGAFREKPDLGVTELSRRLGLHKNNVFRLLATLEQHGYIEQSPDSEEYRLGVRCLELGQAYSRSRTLLQRARPLLEQLAAECGESAHLAVMEDFDVLHVDGTLPERLLLTGLRVGTRLPVHATALGKVLLGCARQEVQQEFARRVTSGEGLAGLTDRTVVDPHKLFEEIRSAAVRGFALDCEECSDGVCCAAAPVFDRRGEAVAALSVSGPAFRLVGGSLESAVVPRVQAAAERLSRDLGYESS